MRGNVPGCNRKLRTDHLNCEGTVLAAQDYPAAAGLSQLPKLCRVAVTGVDLQKASSADTTITKESVSMKLMTCKKSNEHLHVIFCPTTKRKKILLQLCPQVILNFVVERLL